eukprot:1193988-Prorocentrum_minimum.AAC.4
MYGWFVEMASHVRGRTQWSFTQSPFSFRFPNKKETPVGVVYSAQGPARRWQLGGPASKLAYEAGWANALHLRPSPPYPRSFITHVCCTLSAPSPRAVLGEHAHVHHLRVGEHDARLLLQVRARRLRGVAVVDPRLDPTAVAARPGELKRVQQGLQRVQLVAGERLHGEDVQRAVPLVVQQRLQDCSAAAATRVV